MSCPPLTQTVTTTEPQTFNFQACSLDAVLNLDAYIITDTTPNLYLLGISVFNTPVIFNITYNTTGLVSVVITDAAQTQVNPNPLKVINGVVTFTVIFNGNKYTINVIGTPSATSITLSILGTAPTGVETGSGQITPLPADLGCGTNITVSPYISIFFVLDNTYLQDIAYTAIIVGDCRHHECGLGKYCGFTQSPYTRNGFSLFYVSVLNIGETVIGQGTLTNKITLLGLNNQFLLYALLKFVLGRLVFDKFSIKWLYRSNYKRLLKKISETIYNNTIPYLLENNKFEFYFKECPNN